MMKGQSRHLADPSRERESLAHLLVHTLAGRALVAGAVIRLLVWVAQRLAGSSQALTAIGIAGTLIMLAGIAGFAWRLIARTRSRLLWRVRQKLILSFVFVGLIPALLIITFFTLCGLLLFQGVSSYVVQTELEALTRSVQFAAATTAVDLSRVRSQRDLERRVARRRSALTSRYPNASLAVVPIARTCASELRDETAAVAPEAPVSAGPWRHLTPPASLPEWIPCRGFSGLMTYWAGSAESLERAEAAARSRRGGAAGAVNHARLFVRAVALPEGSVPGFAVVLDLPIDAEVARQVRAETGIGVGAVAMRPTRSDVRPMLGRQAAGVRQPDDTAPGEGAMWSSVVFLPFTDWSSGRAADVELSIDISVGDLYDRLSSSLGSVGEGLVLITGAVGVLLLIIQFVALLMGLTIARSITGSVHELFTGTERVRQGDFSHQIHVETRDQLGELADSFNSMTARLGELLVEMAEKKRLEEELRIAREIQMSLLPQQPPLSLPGVSLTALCHPAREVGGDYYDFLPLGSNRLGLLIADVSGKGTSAALYMAELKGLMLSLSQIHRSPRDLLIAANNIICDHLDSRSFITMIYAVLDLDAGTMTWARAGHTPVLHLAGGGRQAEASILVPDGLVLGLKLDNGERFAALLEEVTTPLDAGDLFMFFTDGLSEQMNPGEDLFGEARLGSLIAQHRDLPFDELRERIVREVRAFADGAPQHDDMTFILLRVNEVAARAVPSGMAEQTVMLH